MSDTTQMSEEQWRVKLDPAQFAVLREGATEPAFTGKYWNVKDDGTYHCIVCDEPLFSSETKYDAGCGWPSFTPTRGTRAMP